MPNFNVRVSIQLLAIAAGLYFSYVTHIGWWAIMGFSYFLAGLFDEIEKPPLMLFFLFITFVCFVLGVYAMKWAYF